MSKKVEPASCISEERHFLDHPEVSTYLRNLFPTIIAESDRGAVLLGASQVDEQIKLLFDSLTPPSTGNKRKKEIFSLTGPFGGFAAKLDVAYVCRLLPATLIEAIHKLRKLRNDVAHKATTFSLKNHQKEIYDIFALLGPGVDMGVNRWAVELMVDSMLERLTTLEHPIDKGKPLFESKTAALDYLNQNKHHLNILEADQPRWEIGLGVGLICGLIIYHRERLLGVIGVRETFAGRIV